MIENCCYGHRDKRSQWALVIYTNRVGIRTINWQTRRQLFSYVASEGHVKH